MIQKLKLSIAVASVAACLGITTQAKADAVVPGSTFDVVLGTYDGTTNVFLYTQKYTVTANTTTGATYNGVRGNIYESESLLSTGQTDITIGFAGSAELFPETGSNDPLYAFLAVGAYGDPLDLTAPFDLSSAIITITAPTFTASGNYLSNIAQTTPFNGSFTNSAKGGVLVGKLQNAGVNQIQLDLTNTAATGVTPEPSSLALLGTGILGIAGFARRRFGKAV